MSDAMTEAQSEKLLCWHIDRQAELLRKQEAMLRRESVPVDELRRLDSQPHRERKR